jgi:hypothetical protein
MASRSGPAGNNKRTPRLYFQLRQVSRTNKRNDQAVGLLRSRQTLLRLVAEEKVKLSTMLLSAVIQF